jgi:hypothetical protein
VAAALEGEAGDVSRTPPGERNNRLFLAAARLGELVGVGAVVDGTVAEALSAAARLAGLTDREARATIRHGGRDAMAERRRPADRGAER